MSGATVLTEPIDPASDRAVYKQIADHLRAAMARGRLREGDQLPSEAQLMEHYGVARMTVRNALRMLQDEGLITAEHGRGRLRPGPAPGPAARLRPVRPAAPQGRQGRVHGRVRAGRRHSPGGHDQGDRDAAAGRGRRPPRLADDAASWCAAAATRSTAGRSRPPCPTSRPTWPAARRSLTPTPARAASTPGWKRPGHTLERFTEEVTARMPTPDEARPLALLARRAGVPAGPHRLRHRRPGRRGLRHDHGRGRLRAGLRPARALGVDTSRPLLYTCDNSSIRVEVTR